MRNKGNRKTEGVGLSLCEQLLEEALLLGLVVLGALGDWALLGCPTSNGALVQVGVTANQVHCALDVCKHLNLLHLKNSDKKPRGHCLIHSVPLINVNGLDKVRNTFYYNAVL